MSATKRKVLIHALGADAGGGLRHLNSLVIALAELDTQRKYVILIRESLNITLPKGTEVIRIPDSQSSGWIARLYHDIFMIPLLAKKNNYSCVISLMNFGPIFLKTPHIFYQCNALYYSDFNKSMASWKYRLEFWMRRTLAAASMKYASVIVTPSNTTKKDILRKCSNIPGNRFKTIYHGFDLRLHEETLNNYLKDAIEQKHGYRFFYPANLAKHKGFDALISIAKILKERIDFSLFLTIERKDDPVGYDRLLEQVKSYGLDSNVVFLGKIPQAQIGSLYKTCDLMIFASVVESFGLPLLEAMAYGCPVVASDTEINREICGEAALFYNPQNPMDGAEKALLALDLDTKSLLLKEGQNRIAERDWSWKENALTLMGVLDQLKC